jgi:hypothetical protein
MEGIATCHQGIGHIGPFVLCMWIGTSWKKDYGRGSNTKVLTQVQGYLCAECEKKLSAYRLVGKK